MQSLDKHTALLCPRSGLGAAAPCGRCHHLTVTVSRWLQPLLLENCQASRRTSCCSGGSGAACPAPSQPAAGASAGAGNLAVESSTYGQALQHQRHHVLHGSRVLGRYLLHHTCGCCIGHCGVGGAQLRGQLKWPGCWRRRGCWRWCRRMYGSGCWCWRGRRSRRGCGWGSIASSVDLDKWSEERIEGSSDTRCNAMIDRAAHEQANHSQPAAGFQCHTASTEQGKWHWRSNLAAAMLRTWASSCCRIRIRSMWRCMLESAPTSRCLACCKRSSFTTAASLTAPAQRASLSTAFRRDRKSSANWKHVGSRGLRALTFQRLQHGWPAVVFACDVAHTCRHENLILHRGLGSRVQHHQQADVV